MKGYIYGRKVNYYETDQMGIVHHSNYVRWMEEARLSLMEELALSYAEMERQGLLIPVLSVSCEYRLPFRYGESFQIQVFPLHFNGIKLSLGYRIYDTEGKLHTTGESSHCFADSSMCPRSLKKSYSHIYEILQEWVLANQEDNV